MQTIWNERERRVNIWNYDDKFDMVLFFFLYAAAALLVSNTHTHTYWCTFRITFLCKANIHVRAAKLCCMYVCRYVYFATFINSRTIGSELIMYKIGEANRRDPAYIPNLEFNCFPRTHIYRMRTSASALAFI